jgi:hypothetical protein
MLLASASIITGASVANAHLAIILIACAAAFANFLLGAVGILRGYGRKSGRRSQRLYEHRWPDRRRFQPDCRFAPGRPLRLVGSSLRLRHALLLRRFVLGSCRHTEEDPGDLIRPEQMLIESFIPNPDAVETHKIKIAASREAVYQGLCCKKYFDHIL